MAGATAFLKQTAMRFPSLAAPILQLYLRRVRCVPRRVEWLVHDLTRELPLHWERRVVRIGNAGRLRVDSRSVIGREIYFRGTCDPDLCSVLETRLRPGMVCIDAGANIGEFTVRSAMLVGPTGQVHAFEASPTTFVDLQDNVALNGLHNVRLNQNAVSGASGTLTFYISRGIASGSSSLQPAHDFSGNRVNVEAITLDAYVNRVGLARVDLVKIDIEGGELDAFHGADGLLSGRHPPLLVFEYHPVVSRRFGVTREQLVQLLESHGYVVSTIGPAAGAPQHAEEAPENILATPPIR